jgi:CDP-6-deoxy-D-xylo-4-hexulose-3-dehydrase
MVKALDRERIVKKIEELITEFYRKKEQRFIPGKTRIQYSGPIFNEKEINAVMKSLLHGWLASGEKVRKFEEKFAEYLGVSDVITTNSGSSANLLAVSTLTNGNLDDFIKAEEEVITPALTFPTTCNSIIQNNLIPVFIDINIGTYNIDPTLIKEAISSKTRAILLVHFLGNPCNMKKIMKIANEYNLYVIEDSCDAHGSEYGRKKVGTFGDMGTFSFYCAHQMTLIEGGAIATNNSLYSPILRSLRAWGRACVCPVCKVALDPNYYCPMRHGSGIEGFERYDKRYLFLNIGYNLKLLELQGAFGLEQLKKLDQFNRKRRENFRSIVKAMKDYENLLILPESEKNSNPSWFAIPFTVRENAGFSRDEIVAWLEKYNIETRPLFTGNIIRQPAYRKIKCRIVGELKNSDIVTTNSFFVGCYPGITEEMREYMISKLSEFLDRYC